MPLNDPGDASMRASDADREATAERLRVALVEGRLDISEYDERLTAAYGALTMGDLAKLIEDLPAPPPVKPDPVLVRKQEQRRKLVKEWRDWAGTSMVLIGIWAVVLFAGGATFFWPIIPMAIWALIIVVGMLFGDEPSEGEERG